MTDDDAIRDALAHIEAVPAEVRAETAELHQLRHRALNKDDLKFPSYSIDERTCSRCGRTFFCAGGGACYCSEDCQQQATQMNAQAQSDPQAYCVNRSAAFYPYTGEPCKSGYQLESGNCRKTGGRIVAVPREQCVAMAGTIELPSEPGITPKSRYPKSMK